MQPPLMVGGSWATSRSKRRWSEFWNRLGQLLGGNEPIEMCAYRYGYQPQRFRWHGTILRVGRVEKVWEHVSRGMKQSRRYFRVRCQNDQTYTLYHDLRLGAWYVEV